MHPIYVLRKFFLNANSTQNIVCNVNWKGVCMYTVYNNNTQAKNNMDNNNLNCIHPHDKLTLTD